MRADRATMAHGLEARLPFLDVNVVKKAAQLKESDMFQGKQGKIALRNAARDYLPESIWNGEKTVFFVPIDEWMRRDFEKQANDIIFKARFLPEILAHKAVKDHLHSMSPYQKWCLSVVERWFDVFIENSGQKPELKAPSYSYG